MSFSKLQKSRFWSAYKKSSEKSPNNKLLTTENESHDTSKTGTFGDRPPSSSSRSIHANFIKMDDDTVIPTIQTFSTFFPNRESKSPNRPEYKPKQEQSGRTSPRLLKEYKYRKTINLSKDSLLQIHNTLKEQARNQTANENKKLQNKAAILRNVSDVKSVDESQTFTSPTVSPDRTGSSRGGSPYTFGPARTKARLRLKKALLASYFIGLLNSAHQKVKFFNGRKPRQSLATVIRKQYRDGQNKHFPILPGSTVNVAWNAFLVTMMLLTAILTPVEISFIQDDDDGIFGRLSIMLYIIFGLDIVMNFLSANYNPQKGLETKFKDIAKSYLKGWFWIDLISSVPFDIFITAMITEARYHEANYHILARLVKFSKIYRLLRVLRLSKLLKLFGNNHSVNKIIKKLKLNYGFLKMIKLLSLVLVLNHFFACVWFFAARFQDFDPDTWVSKANLVDADPWTQYVASFYWASQTLTTVGYGDISAETATEKMLAILWMIVGVGFYSYTIGNLSSILADMDRRAMALKNKLMGFNNFANQTKLPEFLRQKVQSFYEYYLSKSPYYNLLYRLNFKENVFYWIDPEDIWVSLPAYLRNSVLLIAYHPMIHNVQLLNMDVNFAIAIALHLKVLRLKKREILYREDDPSEEIYFICKGSVSLITEEGSGIFSFVQGTYFGEFEILNKTKRMCFCQASDATKLLACDREVFTKILKKFPKVEEQVNKTFNFRKEKFTQNLNAIKQKKLAGSLNPARLAHHKMLLKSSVYFLSLTSKKTDTKKLNESIVGDESVKSRNSSISSALSWARTSMTPKSGILNAMKNLRKADLGSSGALTAPDIKPNKPSIVVSILDDAADSSRVGLIGVNSSNTSRFGRVDKGSIELDFIDECDLVKRKYSLKRNSYENEAVKPPQQNRLIKSSSSYMVDPDHSDERIARRSKRSTSLNPTPGAVEDKQQEAETKPKSSFLQVESIDKGRLSSQRRSSLHVIAENGPITEESVGINTRSSLADEKSVNIEDMRSIFSGFSRVSALRERNEKIVEDMNGKRKIVNTAVSSILNRQSEIDSLVLQFFELRKTMMADNRLS